MLRYIETLVLIKLSHTLSLSLTLISFFFYLQTSARSPSYIMRSAALTVFALAAAGVLAQTDDSKPEFKVSN